MASFALRVALSAVLLAAAAGCDSASLARDDGFAPAPPAGWPAPPPTPHNPLTPEKVALGRALFFDVRLSGDGTVACASCHLPERAFTDGLPVSVGTAGRRTLRNAPSLVGVAYERFLHADGGVLSLEGQVLSPLEEPEEMDADLGTVLAFLNADPEYRDAFQRAFGPEGASVRTLTQALAAYQRTLMPTGAPYDRFLAGDAGALSPEAQRGRDLFFGRAGCVSCHAGVRLTDGSFRHNGLTPTAADPGRALVTGNPADTGRFRVPSLRNVALTAPYMRDGRLPTLGAVVAHYDRGGDRAPGQDPAVRPLSLTEHERAALVAFLESLTDARPADPQAPRFP